MAEHGGTVETVKEAFGKTPEEVARRWHAEIELALDNHKKWHEQGDKVVTRYRDEDRRTGSRFNILWANTETLKPTLYGATPIPDVRRRITDSRNPDPVARDAAMILERGLAFSIDDYPFDSTIISAIEDWILPGRGAVRITYEPTFAPVEAEPTFIDNITETIDPETGEVTARKFFIGEDEVPEADVLNVNAVVGEANPAILGALPDDQRPYILAEGDDEEVVYEEVRCEPVYWKHLLTSPEPRWEDKRWIAFESQMTRDELVSEYGDVGKKVTLDFTPSSAAKVAKEQKEFFKSATVYEIWDRDNREVIVLAKSYKDSVLETNPDPLHLRDFFPMPPPLMAITTTDEPLPIPMFLIYQDQADELDRVTGRITKLIEGLKVRGVYDKVEAQLKDLVNKPDNTLIGIDNFHELVQKGGLDGIISFLPIEQIAKVLSGLYLQRDQIKQTIYEIIGLSDILRAATDPQETARAQTLKAQFGSLRLSGAQREVQRFVRDIFRIKAEVMAEHFSPESLSVMTGIETTDEIMDLIRSDSPRVFRIDIETDSTIAADDAGEQKRRTEFLAAITGFANQWLPGVQAGVIPFELFKALLMFGVRGFKVGREIEDALEQFGAQQGQQQGPSPEQQAAAKKMEQDANELALEAKKHNDTMVARRDEMESRSRTDMRRIEIDRERSVRERGLGDQRLVLDRLMHRDTMIMRRRELESKETIELDRTGREQATTIDGRSHVTVEKALDREHELTKIRLQHTLQVAVVRENNKPLASALTEIHTVGESMKRLGEGTQKILSEAVSALVQAAEIINVAAGHISAPKKIIRDRHGRPVGLEVTKDD